METLLCDIDLPATAIAGMYAGTVRFIQARARDGRQVRFPVRALQPFVTRTGVCGTFALTIDAEQRLHSVCRRA